MWRPVEAVHVRGDLYRIIQTDSQPDDERWPFQTDSIVRCTVKKTEEGDLILVADEQVKVGPES